MVSISDSMTVENAGEYYRHHYSTTGEYYAESESAVIGQAIGKGAEALGLTAGVTGEQFEALLRGHDPFSDVILRAKCTREDAVARAGFDMTFSPPKSISLQALVAGDTRLIAVVRQATMVAIGEAEHCAFARQRQHGVQEWVQTSNICAVMFEHHDARESLTSEHGPDPQLHFHCFVNNLSQLSNGQWRALDGAEIYRSRSYLNGVFMAEVARGVQAIGYRIYRGSEGSFELEGYSRAQIEAFSQRSKDIERQEAELGLTDPRMARDIRLETRKPKREHAPAALKAERAALATELGIDLNYRPTAPVQTFNVSPQVQAQRSLDFALADTTERWAAPDYRKIMAAALKHGIGATDLKHVQEQLETRHEAHRLFGGMLSHSHPLGHYTTREMAALERENLTLVRNQIDRGQPIAGIPIRRAVDGKIAVMGTQGAAQWIAARKLLPDHAQAAFLTLTTPQWASAIEGIAGTAKTTLVGAMAQFARQQGWQVRGFGVISGARHALEKVGLDDSRTVAKALASPLPLKSGRELWFVDESSLLSSRDLNALLKLAIERGVERIVFVGDQHQHLSISAGHPLRQLLVDNLAVAELAAIRRQKEPGLLHAIELAYAQRIPEALDLLTKQDRIIAEPDRAKRYERIAADFLDAYEARQNCLVVSPANDERRAINQVIRSTLVAHQYVNSIGRQHNILIPHEMSPEERRFALSYHEHDLLYFTRGSKRLGISQGEYLKIETVSDRGLSLTANDGRRIENFNPATLKGIRAYTPETRTIAVGDRLEWREPDNKHRIANHQYGTITQLDDRNIEVEFDGGRKLSMPLADARRVDLGYASTSHASQGSTVHRVLINVDSRRGVDLVNERQLYVSISRPEFEARIYTDDLQQMRRAVSRQQEKELALDVVERRQQSMRVRISL